MSSRYQNQAIASAPNVTRVTRHEGATRFGSTALGLDGDAGLVRRLWPANGHTRDTGSRLRLRGSG